jgi:hypothetical protein
LDVGIGDGGGGRQCNAKLKYEPADQKQAEVNNTKKVESFELRRDVEKDGAAISQSTPSMSHVSPVKLV